TAGIGHDREQGIALGRNQARARGQIDVALLADRVDGAVAIARIVRVVKQRVDGLVTLEVDDAEDLASFDELAKAATGLEHLVGNRARRVECAFLERHVKYRSVRVKPRSFSAQELRAGACG